MTPPDFTDHELVAVDHRGQLCTCGFWTRSWVEHAAALALTALDAPPATRIGNSTTQASVLQKEHELRERARLAAGDVTQPASTGGGAPSWQAIPLGDIDLTEPVELWEIDGVIHARRAA